MPDKKSKIPDADWLEKVKKSKEPMQPKDMHNPPEPKLVRAKKRKHPGKAQ